MIKKKHSISPQLFIVITFLITILVGSALLSLPISTRDRAGLSFMDALFVATSATCVTGLSTITCGSTLSMFGQAVLAILIEIGGLSFLTVVSFVFIMFGRKMDLRHRLTIKEQMNQDTSKGVVRLVKNVVLLSLAIQLVGAIASTLVFAIKYKFGFGDSLRYGIFHSISSFNNAGFDLFVYEDGGSLIHFRNDIALNIITMSLILLGGIGFITMTDVFKKKKWRLFSLNTKIVLFMTAVLFVGGTVFFKLFMWNEMTWLQAMFSSVTARTAGFATIDMSELHGAAYVLMIILMFIGASPCSTGGGFKTTSFLVLVCSQIGYIRGKTPHAFNRKISQSQIEKTFALFILEILYLLIAIIIVSIAEKIGGTGITEQQTVFEIVSAFATVGLSQNATCYFTFTSKIVIIITMFFGRLGPLTIVSAWNDRKNMLVEKDIKYVEGKIIIG